MTRKETFFLIYVTGTTEETRMNLSVQFHESQKRSANRKCR